jgi:hypothetical protein
MQARYRLTCRGIRGGKYYCVDKTTGKRTSLQTTDREEATRLLAAMDEAGHQPAVNLQIARAYLAASDPQIPEPEIYLVQPGDSATRIVKNLCVTVERLLELNPGVDWARLKFWSYRFFRIFGSGSLFMACIFSSHAHTLVVHRTRTRPLNKAHPVCLLIVVRSYSMDKSAGKRRCLASD